MSALNWADLSDKTYENGVSNGVFYPVDGPGEVWNGLISVEELLVGGSTSALYFEGTKFLDNVTLPDFEAKVKTFAMPENFGPYMGERVIRGGFVATKQPRERFGLSYRTSVGDGLGHRLHLVYNCLAFISKRTYTTLAKGVTPAAIDFSLSTIPVEVPGAKPGAHLVLDSRIVSPIRMAQIEDILYGSPTTSPRLPMPEELVTGG